ncbi:hypothetical protein [Anaerosolibacter sp.]|uniref:hypothetical protein n=1 Tax=Anaerosolibacter sp. TaxID=1872527 RepID=UPI0039EFE567
MIFLNRKITNGLLVFQMVILLAFFCLGQSLIVPVQSISDENNFSGTYLTSYDSYIFLQVARPIERNRNIRSLHLLYNAFLFWAFFAYIFHLHKMNKRNTPKQDIYFVLFKKLRMLLNAKDNGSKYKASLLWI